ISIAPIPVAASMTEWPATSSIARCTRRAYAESSTIMIFAMSDHLHDARGHLIECCCAVADTRFDDRARHSVDDARRLRFRDDASALCLDMRRPDHAVVAPTGHAHPE